MILKRYLIKIILLKAETYNTLILLQKTVGFLFLSHALYVLYDYVKRVHISKLMLFLANFRLTYTILYQFTLS